MARVRANESPARQPHPRRGRAFHEVSLSDRHHRRGFPLRERLRARHPRARRGDREGGHGDPRRHELRRPLAVRPAAEPRVGIHPVDRRRGVHAGTRARPGRAEPAQVHPGDPLQERGDPDLPLRRDAHVAAHPERRAARAARLHPHVRGHAGVRRAAHHPRDQGLHGLAGAAVLPRAGRLCAGRLVFVALPGTLGRRRVPEEPGRPDVPPVLRREHAARRRVQFRRRAGPAARSLGPGRRCRAQRGADLQRRPLLLRHQRHFDLEQDGLARQRRAERHRRRRPQLPRVDPARDHDDGRDSGVPAADAKSSGHHRSDPALRVPAGEHPEAHRGEPVRARGEEQEAADPDADAEHVRRHRLQRRDAEADAQRHHRDAALRRGVAAARGVPRFLPRHARDRPRPSAQQELDDLRDALDAQAARRHLAGLADHRPGVRDARSSTGTSSTRPT